MIEFDLINPKMISVNEQYIHPVRKTKNGRYVSYFAKSSYLKEVQSYFDEVLKEKIKDKDVEILVEETSSQDLPGVLLEMTLGLPRKDFYEYDLSNFIKAVEDCLTRRTGIDDNRNVELNVKKVIYETDRDDWKLFIRIASKEVETIFPDED